MPTLSDIQSEIAALPPNLRAEVIDFVQFVKRRHGLPTAPAPNIATTETGDSAFFQALEAIGFVGCIESDEQLSTTYKGGLDFSGKCGTQP
jgi:hypothetical protein